MEVPLGDAPSRLYLRVGEERPAVATAAAVAEGAPSGDELGFRAPLATCHCLLLRVFGGSDDSSMQGEKGRNVSIERQLSKVKMHSSNVNSWRFSELCQTEETYDDGTKPRVLPARPNKMPILFQRYLHHLAPANTTTGCGQLFFVTRRLQDQIYDLKADLAANRQSGAIRGSNAH